MSEGGSETPRIETQMLELRRSLSRAAADPLTPIDAHKYPELAAVTASAVPDRKKLNFPVIRPDSPISVLANGLDSPQAFKSIASCSDIRSLMDTFSECSENSEYSELSDFSESETLSSLSRRPSISLPLQVSDSVYAERLFPCGERHPVSEPAKARLAAAWQRQAGAHGVHQEARRSKTWELRTPAGKRYFVTDAPLNRGQFAEFGLAVDAAGDRFGVRKVHLRPELDQHTEAQSAPDTHREIRAMDRFTPSLRVLDTVRVGPDLYQILPLMAGSLHEALDMDKGIYRGPHRDALTRHVGLGLCQALDALHGRGGVHGDLKPGNALWDGYGAVALGDAGGALKIDASGCIRRGDVPTVTARYMAPEMMDDKAAQDADDSQYVYGQAVDIWSLGWMLLESRLGRADSLLNTIGDWSHAYTVHADLQAWRENPDPNNRWADYLGRGEAEAPTLTRFVVDEMLTMKPHERASLARVKQFLRAEQRACGDEPQQVLEIFARMSQIVDGRRARRFASVLAHRDVASEHDVT